MGANFEYNFITTEEVKSQEDSKHFAVSRLIQAVNEKHYKKYNKYPRRIFIYRSDVGPRDMSFLIKDEIKATY